MIDHTESRPCFSRLCCSQALRLEMSSQGLPCFCEYDSDIIVMDINVFWLLQANLGRIPLFNPFSWKNYHLVT